jgi:hypothetical protein
MSRPKPPRIVAELGRPETPEEAAARKAESSRAHRESKTLYGLIGALLASLAIVILIVLVVVRPDPEPREPIDYRSLAAEAEASLNADLAAPELPDGWTANSARVETGSDDIASWYVGFITPDNQFIAVRQGVDANATWLAQAVQDSRTTGERTVAGTTWDVHDRRSVDPTGNFAYSMTTTEGDSFALHGTADDEEFDVLATAIAEQLGWNG